MKAAHSDDEGVGETHFRESEDLFSRTTELLLALDGETRLGAWYWEDFEDEGEEEENVPVSPRKRQRFLEHPSSLRGKYDSKQQRTCQSRSQTPADPFSQESQADDEDEVGNHLIDSLNCQKNLKAVTTQLQDLRQTIDGCSRSQDTQSKIHLLAQETKKLGDFQDREERIVGLIGDTGAGKSSLINSIMGQRGLARSSGAGAACTSVPMEYRYLDDKHPTPYTIETDFMSEEEVAELLEELLRSIRRAYNTTDRTVLAEEDWSEYETIGERSYDTLQAIFRSRKEYDLDYFLQPNKELDILEELKQTALESLSFGSKGESSLHHSVVAKDLEACKIELDHLTSDPEDLNAPVLWPFIKLVRIFLHLPLLEHGLVLADLPGLRDTNHARVRATEKYLAHTCDEVFIVTPIARCVSNESIYEIIKKCGQTKQIRIVCTRADEISPDELARGKSPFAERIRKINAEIEYLETRTHEIGRERRTARGNAMAGLAMMEAMNDDQIYTLQFKRKAILMSNRNESVKRELRDAIQKRENRETQTIRIFCIGNELYRNPPSKLAKKYRDLSGVGELQTYCRGIPAEARTVSAVAYIQHEVPALVLGGSADIFKALLSPSGLLIAVQKEALPTFENLVIEHLRSHVDKLMMTEFITVSEKWRGWHWTSYAALCRKYGTHTTRKRGYSCWNDQLKEQVRSWLDPRWDMVDEWLLAHKLRMSKSITGLFENFSTRIKAHRHAAPDVIENLILALRHRGENMQQALSHCMSEFQQKVKLARQHTLDGHNHSALIADLMRQVYNACSRESGVGSDRRRKEAMQRHLSDQDFYAKYLESTKSFYQNTIKASMVTVKKELEGQIDLIAGDFAGVTMSSEETPEPEAEPELAKELAKKIPLLQESLDRASKSLQLTSS
ncbi:hypothetical protein N7539_000915 [Penicillium diatomitis]|uniref:Nuclear GTPase SLIP-GC n=1 Tax=Penicillium diatomitis TaxID=2819901 RepID=A0A9W9XP41_9EURO|nr:uncharacterized protein N7539_000915 [Penicillium diatomitis]KAJ5495799.1 hypothetical protein N7539_000915 [Penicillium diatomitis]